MTAPRWLTVQAIGKNCTLLVDTLGLVDVEEIDCPNHQMEASRIADARNFEEALDEPEWVDLGEPVG